MAADGIVPSGALDPDMSALLKPLVDVIVAEIPDGEELREEFERGLILYGEGLLQSARAVLQQARQERDEQAKLMKAWMDRSRLEFRAREFAETQLAAQDAEIQGLKEKWGRQADAWNNIEPMDYRAAQVLHWCVDGLASVRVARREGER